MRFDARLAKVETALIAQAMQAWERMTTALSAGMLWVIDNGTPEQQALLDKLGSGAADDMAAFSAIALPDELNSAAARAIHAFDCYPSGIKAEIVARRKAMGATV